MLEQDTAQVIHDRKSSYSINIGLSFFKKMNLSPNVTIYFLMILATYEMTKKFSVLNHAVSLKDHNSSAMQLDWIYVSLDKLKEFVDVYHQYPESELYFLFTKLVNSHKEKIVLSQNGLSPTFFVKNTTSIEIDQLYEFYIYLGKFCPVYRNYLFRAHRNPDSIDIMASSLRLPNSIQAIGRYGTFSEILTQFGVHIFVKDETTKFVFIPNKHWLDKLDELSKQLNIWANRIQFMAYLNAENIQS